MTLQRRHYRGWIFNCEGMNRIWSHKESGWSVVSSGDICECWFLLRPDKSKVIANVKPRFFNWNNTVEALNEAERLAGEANK